MMRRVLIPILMLISIAFANCNHQRQPAADDPAQYDHVTRTPQAPPVHIVHGGFTLGKFQKFAFDVPPHVVAPKVKGQFSSSTPAPDGSKVSDESADVELMVMTDAQFDDFMHRRSAESVDAIEPSHNHGVSISLPGSQDEPMHYYVVFRRSMEGKATISVNADITAEFDASM